MFKCPNVVFFWGGVGVGVGGDNDGALASAERFMGGEPRIGLLHAATVAQEHREWLLDLERFHVINVSRGSGERGFDITGHRYWFKHPWASSDVVLAIRTDLGPDQRGLVGVPPEGEPEREPIVWAIPADYPDRLRALGDLRGQAALREWTPDGDEGLKP